MNELRLNSSFNLQALGVEGDDPRLLKDYRSKQIQLIEEDLMADRLG